jgi:acetyl esterase
MSYFKTYPATAVVPLNPKIKASLDVPPVKFATTPIGELRASVESSVAAIPASATSVARVENRDIPGSAGPIPIRVYTPNGRGPFPLLVVIHGGGWILGSLDTADAICRSICDRVGCIIVSVAYRLSPEVTYPAPLDDCCEALQWTAGNAASLGGRGDKIAIYGGSSGANLAAAVALRNRDLDGPRLALQILIVPTLNYGFDTASYHENAESFGLTRDDMIYFWDTYLSDPSRGCEPYASPLRAKDLSGLPPTLIITAHYDPLRDDGEAYAARLHQAGVPVRLTRYLDVHHSFFGFAAVYDSAERAHQEVAEALRDAFQ